MRLFKSYDFKGIKGYQLGWSLFGSPLMTVYCYASDDFMVDTGQSHMQNESLGIAENHHIKRIFLTHHHEDHSGNAAAIKQELGVKVFGHPMTMEKMSNRSHILPYQRYIWGKSKPLSMEPVLETIKTALGNMVPVHTPGHSKDHTIYLLEEKGILFSGDLYLGDKIKFFRVDEDIGAQIASLKKVAALDFKTLLCSHHPKLENGKQHIKRKLGFLENLYGNIMHLWQKGIREKEIFARLYLKEDYFIKYFCFGNVSMMNGVKSVVRHYESGKGQ